MKYVVGIDIGNSTTEGALAKIEEGRIEFLASSLVKTTGVKGTLQNKHGIYNVLNQMLKEVRLEYKDIDLIRINEAAPVIGDVAMETITETIITESTMIGHNPKTPGGVGLSSGFTVHIKDLRKCSPDEEVVVIVPKEYDFEEVARELNEAVAKGVKVKGGILQKDDAVLVSNRLNYNIPIIDEVSMIEKISF